jgi:uncharacterized protein
VDEKERTIRAFFEARARQDYAEIRALVADDIVWHEPGEADYSGDHVGADEVVAMMRRLYDLTGGTFVLEPLELLTTDDHAVARTRWFADRDGTHCEGNELAVYRFAGGRIAEVWFFYDGYDQEAHDAVFSFQSVSTKDQNG